MSGNSELKRLVDFVLKDRRFCGDENHKALAEGVLAMIAENARLFKLLERTVDQHVPLTELEGVPGWSRVVELVEVVAERDQLKAENEALRKDADRYRWLRNDMNDVAITFGVHSWEDLSGEFMDSAIDAAMFQGEKP